MFADRAVEQLVARWAHNPKVAGSNPARANSGEVAQSVRARGSYPRCGGFESLPRYMKKAGPHGSAFLFLLFNVCSHEFYSAFTRGFRPVFYFQSNGRSLFSSEE